MRNLFVVTFALLGVVYGQGQPPLSLKQRIDLENVSGRIDHLSVDIKTGRVFVAALGNGTVEVLDMKSGRQVSRIAGLAEPQGVHFDLSTDHLFVACGGDGTVRVFDAAGAFEPAATARFRGDADNLRYDPRRQRIIVGFGDGGLGFLDLNGQKTGEIGLDAHPESFQLERSGSRAFVNVPVAREIQVVDLARDAVIGRWPVALALDNFPMALDEAHQRLFLGYRKPARMLVLSTETGKLVFSGEIVGDTDDIFYNPGKRQVYVIGGEGWVDVFEQNDPDHYNRVAKVATAPGARTGLYVPEWGEILIAAPKRGDRSAQILVCGTK